MNNITVRHQNGSKLHLDLKDNKVLTEKFTEAVSNILHGESLLPSLTKAHDSGSHDCDEYKATSKRSVMNINFCQKNSDKIVIVHLNINSITQNFDGFIQITIGNFDILMITEPKLDASFGKGQFLIKEFSEPYRLDRNSNTGGIMLPCRENISSKLQSIEKIQ